MVIKIAAVTEDNVNLSSHFGMAPYYRVLSVEDGKILAEEGRDKPHHGQHPDHQLNLEDEHHSHGHADMLAPIKDCQVLLCGGMGEPAYRNAKGAGLEVVLTGGEIDMAVKAYLNAKRHAQGPYAPMRGKFQILRLY